MTPAHILLVDDEPSLLLTVGDQLRLEGYEVTPAKTGEEAIQAMRHQTPDLIILDISMPGMTGLALLKKLSGPDGKPHYPILIFTARANMEQFFKTTAVEGFLPKTSDPTQLLAEVKRILLKTRKDSRTAPPPAGPKPRRTVLILEDDPTLNMRLKTSFTIAGYETLTITDGHALAQTLQSHSPSVILLKSLLAGTTGNAIAASLADYTTARGIAVILYDASGIHKPGDKFVNVTKFVPSNLPADLLKATATLLS
jgi:DNA-binding response OmpR family regulator